MRCLGLAASLTALLTLATTGPHQSGAVRVAGRALADNGGPFTVLGASLFWAAWGYRHDRPRLEANLAFLARHGVDAVRVLGTVGPDAGWEDRVVDPAWPDYDEVVTGVTDLAFDRYGLRVQWTVFGGVDNTPTRESRTALVERFERLLEPRAEKVLFVEIANEGYQTGFGGAAGIDEIRSLGRDLAARSPLLVALTAPENVEANRDRSPRFREAPPSVMTLLNLYRPGDVDVGGLGVATFHYDRDVDGAGGLWEPARLPWLAAGLRSVPGVGDMLPPIFASNEPIGPGSSVSEESDPARLAAAALVAWISGHAVHVYHSGAGVRGGGQADLDRGRPANIHDLPNVVAQLDALARAQDLMPGDVANWATVGPDDAAHPFGPNADDTYCARRGPDFVCAAIAIENRSATLTASSPMRVTVHDPVAGGAPRLQVLIGGEPVLLEPARSVAVITGRFGVY